MVAINRADILAVQDAKCEPVECPEWGGTVYVRTITAKERDRWELLNENVKTSPGTANVRGSLLAMAICDEHGKSMFTMADAEALGAKSANVIDRLYEAAAKLNGIGNRDTEETKKKSSETRGDGSS